MHLPLLHFNDVYRGSKQKLQSGETEKEATFKRFESLMTIILKPWTVLVRILHLQSHHLWTRGLSFILQDVSICFGASLYAAACTLRHTP